MNRGGKVRYCMWCGLPVHEADIGSYCMTERCPVYGLLAVLTYTSVPKDSELRANPMLRKNE